MTREELYEQVWSQPMRTLAASMGISDVALAKRCKAANVPVPPRGWWAKKEAGKAAKVEPLPPLPFALANYFPAYEDVPNGRDVDQSDGEKVAALPERPVFRDLAQVQAEIRAAVKPVKVPATLTTPHPIVADFSSRTQIENLPPAPPIPSLPTEAPNFLRPCSSVGCESCLAS